MMSDQDRIAGGEISLSTFAHDLRQPLREILLGVQRIRKDCKTPEEIALRLDEIVEAARRQDQLISSVVEYETAVEDGMDSVTRIPLTTAIRTAILKVEPFRLAEAGIVTIDDDLPPHATVLAGVAKVLEKVVHNGLKFHPPGVPPEVSVTASDVRDWLIVRVTDNGVGIEPQYRDSVFKPFFRLNPTSHYPGSGLGLSICRRLLDSIGGTIHMEPRENGKGTVALIRFPANAAAF